MSSFEFDFFGQQTNPKEPNLEQVMQQVQQNSFDFDQFDPVDEHAPAQKSYDSDFFATNKQERVVSAKSKEDSHQFQFENSRNISEISYLQDGRNRSFKYENPPVEMSNQLKTTERYQKLQNLISKAKQNNLDMFYRNLEEQNVYAAEDKFRNKDEFKNYRNELKQFKRKKQLDFKDMNGNYLFKDNHYRKEEPITVKRPEIQQLFGREAANFKKKQSFANNFLPSQYATEEEDALDFELKPEQIKREVQKYQEKEYIHEGEIFFNAETRQSKEKKEKKIVKLESIHQQRANIFELTHEEEKMSNLLKNYKQIKDNFVDLMNGLKSTNDDQQKIMNQFKKLKIETENKESRLRIEEQNKKQKKIIKQKEKEQKNKKIVELKEGINRMRDDNQKDIIFMKLNQKIENLEDLVKNAIQQITEVKQEKFVPKIINYYAQPPKESRPESNRSRSQHSQVGLSRQQPYQSGDSQIGRLDEQYFLGPVRNAIRQLKQQKFVQQLPNGIDDFSSPLQLDLTTQDFPLNISRNRSMQLQAQFVPPEKSKEYQPNALDTSNKFLRRCLTQKSSILFQSFEFYITGKFTITNNDRYPVMCEIRVANKCAISLYDIFVIVYGPQAQQNELQMRPSKIMYDEFKYNTSFLLEVDLSKSCLDNGSFNVQISYKTDAINKKKINFKAILPFIQLIKPQFIYEEQFVNAWSHMGNEFYIKPKMLDFKNIRRHEDLKLILPFIEIGENDPNSFTYGIMFSYPKSNTIFMMKVTCYISGKASIHVKNNQNSQNVDKRLRQQVLDIMNYLCFG